MPYYVYLYNNSTGKVIDNYGPYNERQKNRAKRNLKKTMARKGYNHVSVHERKVRS